MSKMAMKDIDEQNEQRVIGMIEDLRARVVTLEQNAEIMFGCVKNITDTISIMLRDFHEKV